MATDDNGKELDEQLIRNETDPHSLKSIISKTKTRAYTTVILGNSIVKNVYGNAITRSIKHVVVKHFSRAKIDDMKHYVKPTQEKHPPQIIIHVGTDLRDNKNSDKIANEIVEFAHSIKTRENNVVVFSIISRKDRINNKAKEVHENLKDECEEHNLR